MSFHWRDGWYFTRRDGGAVEIRQHDKVALQIPALEWASIVASVSKRGETAETYKEARELHGIASLSSTV